MTPEESNRLAQALIEGGVPWVRSILDEPGPSRPKVIIVATWQRLEVLKRGPLEEQDRLKFECVSDLVSAVAAGKALK